MQNIVSGTQVTFLVSSTAFILTKYNFNQTCEIPNSKLLNICLHNSFTMTSMKSIIQLNTQKVSTTNSSTTSTRNKLFRTMISLLDYNRTYNTINKSYILSSKCDRNAPSKNLILPLKEFFFSLKHVTVFSTQEKL